MDSPSSWTTVPEAAARGLALRADVPHALHAAEPAMVDRPTVAEFLRARAAGRIAELVPLGHERMAASPFAFFRGTAGLMAIDLASTPTTGVHGQICGDAHAANFGLYGTADGRIVMDVNDFDETVVGPWEWDLKRLSTSLVLAGRTGARVGDKATRKAARHASRSYRRMIRHLAARPFLDTWTGVGDGSTISFAAADALFDDFERAATSAARNTSERAALKLAHRHGDEWHFVEEPPELTSVPEAESEAVIESLGLYRSTLQDPWGRLVARFRPRAVAHRVVGTGSIGLRSYVVLLQGNGDESLVLQLKQAVPSALSPFVPTVGVTHHGARIVQGARFVQADTDPLMGWTSVEDQDFVVRQFRNRKGSIDATLLTADHLDDYARLAGALLARGHARSVDARVLAAYLAQGREFDEAVAAFSLAYAGQVETDHQALVAMLST